MPLVARDVNVGAAEFAFGAIHLRFETKSSEVLSDLERRYGGFASSASAPNFTIRFETTKEPLPPGLPSRLAVRVEPLECTRTTSGFRVRTPTTSAEIDLAEKRGTVRGPAAMYPLDNLLRHLLPILWDRGLIVHAAAIEDGNGRGWLASGASGAGKSTLAGLAGAQALSDELAALRLDGTSVRLVSLPFWQARPGQVDLRSILMLRHGSEHRLEPLSSGAAFRELTTQILWPTWDETAMARSFDHLTRLVELVPVFALSFRPEASVFEVLKGLAA